MEGGETGRERREKKRTQNERAPTFSPHAGLHEQREAEEQRVKDEAAAKKTLAAAEAEAEAQFAADRAAAAAAREALGTWVRREKRERGAG